MKKEGGLLTSGDALDRHRLCPLVMRSRNRFLSVQSRVEESVDEG